MTDRCVMCGAPVPEGRQVCFRCEHLEESKNGVIRPTDYQTMLNVLKKSNCLYWRAERYNDGTTGIWIGKDCGQMTYFDRLISFDQDGNIL